MSINLTGTLLSPNGDTINNASIKLVAKLTTDGGVIKGSTTVFTSDVSTGVYTETIENGQYDVYFHVADGDKYNHLGAVEIDDTTASPSSLEDLLTDASVYGTNIEISTLYYSGSEVLITTSNGITITGEVLANSVSVSDVATTSLDLNGVDLATKLATLDSSISSIQSSLGNLDTRITALENA